jgi:hypothetical protein
MCLLLRPVIRVDEVPWMGDDAALWANVEALPRQGERDSRIWKGDVRTSDVRVPGAMIPEEMGWLPE